MSQKLKIVPFVSKKSNMKTRLSFAKALIKVLLLQQYRLYEILNLFIRLNHMYDDMICVHCRHKALSFGA